MQPEVEVLTANLKAAREAIICALDTNHLSRDHGENLLAYVIGLSRGQRGVDIASEKIAKSMALGYAGGLKAQKAI